MSGASLFTRIISTIREAGVLRQLLFALTVFLVLIAPFAFLEESREGFRFFAPVVAPALIPPMFFVYPLDMTMCLVKKDGAPDPVAARLSRMIKLNAWSMLALFLAWLPFFFSLLA